MSRPHKRRMDWREVPDGLAGLLGFAILLSPFVFLVLGLLGCLT